MKYNKTQSYSMKVSARISDGNCSYYIVEDEETQYRVRMYKFQEKKENPPTIYCKMVDIDPDGSPIFVQDKYKVLSSLYKIGDTAPFSVSTRTRATERERDVYIVCDSYGFSAQIPVWFRESLPENMPIQCKIAEITPSGSLKLELDKSQISLKSNFVTYETLLNECRIENIQEAFSMEALKSNKNKKYKINNILTQYEQENGLWIISYLSFINASKSQYLNQGDIEACKLSSLLYSQIAEWVLEDSPFLSVYSSEMATSLRTHIEQELEQAKIQLYAIELIKRGQADTYLDSLLRKIKVSGYLCNSSTRIKTIIQLLSFHPDMFNLRAIDFLYFIRLISHEDINENNRIVLTFINKFIHKECVYLDQKLLFYTDQKDVNERLETVIRYLSAALLLNKKTQERDIRVWRSMLYRYLSFLDDPEYKQIFQQMALDTLFYTSGYTTEFCWQEILDFKPTQFASKVRSFINTNETFNDNKQHLMLPYGGVIIDKKTITLTPGLDLSTLSVTKMKPVITLLNGQINIYVSKLYNKDWKETYNLQELRKQWNNLYDYFYDNQPKRDLRSSKQLPPPGTSVLIRTKAINKNYPLLVFAEIVDEQYEGSGVLHVSCICRYYVKSLEDIFKPNEIFRVTVKNVENGKLAFSILDEIGSMTANDLEAGSYVTAKLMRISKDICTWVEERGYILYSPLPEKYKLPLGIEARLLIEQVLADGYVEASFVEETNAEIDELFALESIVRKYISYSQMQEIKEEEEEENENMLEEPAISMGNTFPSMNIEIAKQFIALIGMAVSLKKDPIDRFNALATARLMSFMIGYNQWGNFYDVHMNYMEELFMFLCSKTSFDFKFSVSEEILNEYPSIQTNLQITQILNRWNKEESNDLLLADINSPNPLLAQIARTVLSNNLLNRTAAPQTILQLKHELVSMLNMELIQKPQDAIEQELEQLVNLGRESGTVEFKTSLVYPAGTSMDADMGKQMQVILKSIAGFLNAEGGTLYIGVRDTGDVIGLKSDFEYMKCETDGYERQIRSHIVRYFSKDINSLISIDFPKHKDRICCKINIPRYEKFVSLNNVIWQRQGNETRILEGMSLIMQRERRQNINTQPKDPEIMIPNNNNILADALKNSIAKKAKQKKAERSIATSLYRNNPIHKGSEDFGLDTICYLSLLENGEYLLTNDLPVRFSRLLTLAVKEEEKESFLLLAYDNGFVNKVPIKLLLSKKRGYTYKNGQFKEARLMFVSIASEDSNILARSIRNDSVYVKLFPISLFKENTDMSLKGSPVFTFNFGTMLQWDVVPVDLSEQLTRLYNNLTSYQGTLVTAEGLDTEIDTLAQYYPAIIQ